MFCINRFVYFLMKIEMQSFILKQVHLGIKNNLLLKTNQFKIWQTKKAPLEHEFILKNPHIKILLCNHVCQWGRPRSMTSDNISSNFSSDKREKSLWLLSNGWASFYRKVCALKQGLLQCMSLISTADKSETSNASEHFISSVGGVKRILSSHPESFFL